MSILGQKADGTNYWDDGTIPSEKEKVCTGSSVTEASNYVAAAGAGEVADVTVCEFASPVKGCSDPVALNFKDTVPDTTLNNTCRYPMFEIRGPNGATRLFKWEELSAKMKAYHLHQMGLATEDLAKADDEEERPFEFDPQIMMLVYVGAGLIGLGLIAYMYKTAKSKK